MGVYRVIVAGSRTFTDYALLERELKVFLKGKRPSEVTIISGTASGADILGERFAKQYKCGLVRCPADWKQFKKSAGYRRNVDMAKQADACIVFTHNHSKGSTHMINIAKDHGLELKIVEVQGGEGHATETGHSGDSAKNEPRHVRKGAIRVYHSEVD